jgi:hypothetical protein
VPTIDDLSVGAERVHLEADTGGRTLFLDAHPPGTLNLNREGAPPVLFLPSGLRAGPVGPPVGASAAVGPAGRRPVATRSPRSASGPGTTATRSASAAGSRPPSRRRTTPRTDVRVTVRLRRTQPGNVRRRTAVATTTRTWTSHPYGWPSQV